MEAATRIVRAVIVALAVLLVISAQLSSIAEHQPIVAAVSIGELVVVGLLLLATRAWRHRAA